MSPAAAIVVAVLAFVLAAKAHGRQLRLERERAGHLHVVFGGQNPPFVEQLWRRERALFWSITLTLSALVAAYGALAAARGWPHPLARTGNRSVVWLTVFPVLAFCPALAFCVTGALSLVRQGGDGLQGSLGWWSAALLALSATAFLAVRSSP